MTSLFATTLLAATVVVTCGVLFLLETLLRRDTGAGRIWSLAFLSGILTVICYLIWAELFQINAICLWCTVVHGLTLILFALVIIRQALIPPAS